jgi:hypothetical protein
VWSNVADGAIILESNLPSGVAFSPDVAVCGCASLFVHVTVLPTLTWTGFGWYASVVKVEEPGTIETLVVAFPAPVIVALVAFPAPVIVALVALLVPCPCAFAWFGVLIAIDDATLNESSVSANVASTALLLLFGSIRN